MVSFVVSRPMQAIPIAGVIAIAVIERKEFSGRMNGVATKRANLEGQRVWRMKRATMALRRRKRVSAMGCRTMSGKKWMEEVWRR